MKLILTCEHATNLVPSIYNDFFQNHRERLETHEGYDIGAFQVYEALQNLASFSFHFPWSRLLIEVNRSLGHPQLFSSISKSLDNASKIELVTDYYQPYRYKIQNKIKEVIGSGEEVLHLSIHSFTPKLNEELRTAEFGILYDPRRREEKLWAKEFKKKLKLELEGFRIRMNYPYLGKADGLTTSLRSLFPRHYLGIELEVNQELLQEKCKLEDVKAKLHSALQSVLLVNQKID